MTATTFAFSCTKCGHCCKGGGPALSVNEIFKYQDVFISGLSWSGRMLHRKLVDAWDGEMVDMQKLRAHILTFSATAPEYRGHDIYPHIYPTVTGYTLARNRGCSALAADGSCTLHVDKPTMCRSIPFDPALPEHLQQIVLRKFNHDCMTTTQDPDAASVVFSAGRITDPSCKADYDKRLDAMKKDRATLEILSFFIPVRQSLAPDEEEFMRAVQSGGWIETPMTLLLLVLLKNKEISPVVAEGYLRSQLALINSEIELALQRRNADERERTGIMRNYLVSYNKFLENWH